MRRGVSREVLLNMFMAEVKDDRSKDKVKEQLTSVDEVNPKVYEELYKAHQLGGDQLAESQRASDQLEK